MPAVTTKAFTGFGIQDLAIAPVPTAPASTPTWLDVPLVDSAEFKRDVKEEELWGDDRYHGTFYHSATGKITCKVNRTSLPVFEAMSGVQGVSNIDASESLYIGTDAELLPPRLMVRAIIPYRKANGGKGTQTVYFFNSDVKTVWDGIPSGARGKIQEVPLVFNVYQSEVDEKGDPVPVFTGGTAAGRLDALDS